jgi:hypothetical protein
MDFVITPMPTPTAEQLRADVGAGRRPATRVALDGPGGPCRHCLRLGAAGEELLLLTYQPFLGEGPYAVPSPIFLHAEPCARYSASDEIPPFARDGLRAARSYDAANRLIDGEVVAGATLESTIERLLANDRADFVHVHSADAGCFTFRVDRRRDAARAA